MCRLRGRGPDQHEQLRVLLHLFVRCCQDRLSPPENAAINCETSANWQTHCAMGLGMNHMGLSSVEAGYGEVLRIGPHSALTTPSLSACGQFNGGVFITTHGAASTNF